MSLGTTTDTQRSKATRVDVRLRQAIESGAMPKQLLMDGPAGTGKTFGILSIIHCIAADYPNLRILFVRQTRASLTNSVMVTFEQEVLPADGMESIASGASRKNRSSYLYPNGTEIVLGGMDSPSRIASTAWDIAFVNESIELEEDGWETIGTRLNRPGRPACFGWLIGDTNPGDPSHWLKKRCDEGRTVRWETNHQANPAMHDGATWTEAGENYLENLHRLRGTRRKRFLEGVWAAGEGQWFGTFTDAHVRAEAAFNPIYPIHLAVDTGVHTGAIWWQPRLQADGNLIVAVCGAYYSFGLPAFENAVTIAEKTKWMTGGRLDRFVTDPAGKASTAIGPTVIGEYHRAGLYPDFWPSYPGSVIDGLSLVESFVSVDPPGLIVHPDCTPLIEAFANYKRIKRGGQWIDKPEDPCHPHEEMIDSLRGGLQDKFPEGRRPAPKLLRVPARKVF